MSAPVPAVLPAYRIDGGLVGPDAFYAVACDPRRHVVVEACAGAGKTWMLVSRIVRSLLDGAQPQEILAITFTRKVATRARSSRRTPCCLSRRLQVTWRPLDRT